MSITMFSMSHINMAHRLFFIFLYDLHRIWRGRSKTLQGTESDRDYVVRSDARHTMDSKGRKIILKNQKDIFDKSKMGMKGSKKV